MEKMFFQLTSKKGTSVKVLNFLGTLEDLRKKIKSLQRQGYAEFDYLVVD
ncbi:MAG: hypothetical protein LHW46_08535 [Candidatus Cloacimonetes bacterium]|nr:hypothetical protein [Candidatus Cloacimonadota bacterium]